MKTMWLKLNKTLKISEYTAKPTETERRDQNKKRQNNKWVFSLLVFEYIQV